MQLGSSKNKHFVHRLVAECFLEKQEGFTFVNHKDGDKTNNCATNLEWCTMRANNIHAIQSGLRVLVKPDADFG